LSKDSKRKKLEENFIAQEMEKVLPELIVTDKDGYKSMIYERLAVVLVEAVKELKAQSDAKISALFCYSSIIFLSEY
jgi:hypothetical protein